MIAPATGERSTPHASASRAALEKTRAPKNSGSRGEHPARAAPEIAPRTPSALPLCFSAGLRSAAEDQHEHASHRTPHSVCQRVVTLNKERPINRPQTSTASKNEVTVRDGLGVRPYYSSRGA